MPEHVVIAMPAATREEIIAARGHKVMLEPLDAAEIGVLLHALAVRSIEGFSSNHTTRYLERMLRRKLREAESDGPADATP